MRKVRPFFTIMILLSIYVLSHYTVGKSIIKSFYDIVWHICWTQYAKRPSLYNGRPNIHTGTRGPSMDVGAHKRTLFSIRGYQF